uniref:Uncharacterized protein n=1 Tax=Haemonchus contortus TaxID=6289 RepID=U6PLR8_HAECO|nr:unnamed protein product [Haemonchus contortus]
MGTLMVTGIRLRPREAGLGRILKNPVKVYNKNQLMWLRFSWLEPLAHARACVAARYIHTDTTDATSGDQDQVLVDKLAEILSLMQGRMEQQEKAVQHMLKQQKDTSDSFRRALEKMEVRMSGANPAAAKHPISDSLCRRID